MSGTKRLRRWLAGWVLAAGLGATGCHSVCPVSDDLAEVCSAVADCSRRHVRIFFIQGHDLLDCADLAAVKHTMQDLGFACCWMGYGHHTGHFREIILDTLHADPQARIVLVGFGHGVGSAEGLARLLQGDGVSVDLLVCLDGSDLEQGYVRPANVGKVVRVIASKEPCDPPAPCDGVEYFAVCAHHLDVPTCPQTVNLLARELTYLAGCIPAHEDLPAMPFPVPEAPRPQPLAAVSEEQEDEWDFLKPAPVDGPLPEHLRDSPFRVRGPVQR
jgi:hypothetical protein